MLKIYVTSIAAASFFAVTFFGILLWKNKKRNYINVGKVKKILFFPVKSLKAVEITGGKCTKKGLVVNGITDRSFMLVDGTKTLLSQRQAPKLVLLTPDIQKNYLLISGPDVKTLKVEIKKEISLQDIIVECRVHTDTIKAIDCGDEAASWFQNFVAIPDVRLVRFYDGLSYRSYQGKTKFFATLKKDHPVSFQDLSPFHLLSEASVDDLSSRIPEEKISCFNFRPNIYVDGCEAYAEDTWKYLKFSGGAELYNVMPCSRCLMTTNNPETGVKTDKEPLATLRKYRVPKDPTIAKLVGYLPCFGVFCTLIKAGDIKIGDKILATVESRS